VGERGLVVENLTLGAGPTADQTAGIDPKQTNSAFRFKVRFAQIAAIPGRLGERASWTFADFQVLLGKRQTCAKERPSPKEAASAPVPCLRSTSELLSFSLSGGGREWQLGVTRQSQRARRSPVAKRH
jgi:hypothetical protein